MNTGRAAASGWAMAGALLAALGSPACGGPECEASPGRICTVAGTGTGGLSEDGKSARESELYLPLDMARSPEGELFIVDYNNHAIRRVVDGALETALGVPGRLGDAPEGPARESAIHHPSHLSFDEGEALVSAWHNYLVLRLDWESGRVARFAGTAEPGFGGDGGAAGEAQLDRPSAAAPLPEGGFAIADQVNQRVRAIDEDGAIATIAGTGEAGYGGDGGPAEEARLHLAASGALVPGGKLDVSDEGAIYLADTENHAIRRIDSEGMIDTVAGTGEPGYEPGDNARSAAFDAPADVQVADGGALYVADTRNHCVRRVPADRGRVEVAAGTCGEAGYEGDVGPADEALLDRPYGVHLADDGTLYIADTHNHVVRAVHP